MIRLVLADDHPVVLGGLSAALAVEPDLQVVATAPDGIAAVRVIRTERPHVAVVDLHLPKRNGLEVVRAVAPVPVLIVTSFDDDAHLRRAREAGAAGFLGKGAPVERVAAAVRALARGETHLLPGVGTRTGHAAGAPTVDVDAARENPLSRREREVLRLIATGLSTPEIAAQLGTRPATVKNQTASILAKLGVEDRTRAVLVALRDGWI